jgi:hypothetical protein
MQLLGLKLQGLGMTASGPLRRPCVGLQPVVRYVNAMRLRTDIWPPQAAESRRARTVTFLLFEVT